MRDVKTRPLCDPFAPDPFARTAPLRAFPDKNYTREKFSFQLSDHLPVWVQIKTDIDGERFNQIVQNKIKAKQ